MEICLREECTGCGMCLNTCTYGAITMQEKEHGFYYPVIDESKCQNCGLCKMKCPNNNRINGNKIRTVYAAWNMNKAIRKRSTSGGVFSLIAERIIQSDGYVAGVVLSDKLEAEHYITNQINEIELFNGSKYVQSRCGVIYKKIKGLLQEGKKVLFSGTPCQNAALKSYLGADYDSLYLIDVVCHGVPSQKILRRYIDEITPNNCIAKSIKFRHKVPNWNYCNITTEFDDGSCFSVPTVDDSYFTLFNIGYSLRESCHSCHYTSTNRQGDISLADFWGYLPQTFKMRDFNKGCSCILINSHKGEELFYLIRDEIVYEERSVEDAKRANKSLSDSYRIDENELVAFWIDYDNEMGINQLRNKYVLHPFKKPKYLWLRNLKHRFNWLIK
ncbi:MAG: Ion-translocating oxidoreductase complex subunit B [Eubacterium sp.]|uniref:Coenzyme F420 hydrogenase/dehydrogenase, beta subunit C-terminal domain n=1 Tax=Eubacterium sp. TaxID=142586 RepID=UPI003031E55A